MENVSNSAKSNEEVLDSLLLKINKLKEQPESIPSNQLNELSSYIDMLSNSPEENNLIPPPQYILDAIIKNSKDIIYVKDTLLRYTECSDTMLTYFKIKKTDFIGKDDLDLFGEKIGADIQEKDREVLSGKSIEYDSNRTINGKNVVLRNIKFPIKDENNDILGICGISYDITESEKTLTALRDSEEEYRLLVETTDAIIIVHDDQGIINFINRSGLDFIGKAFDEIIGTNIWELVPKEEIQNVKQRAEQRTSGVNERLKYDITMVNNKNEPRIFEIHSSTMLRKGKFSGILLVARDITDRKKAELQSHESKMRLRTLINATPDIICFKDGNGAWLEANNADLELFGLRDVDYYGKTDAQLAEFTNPIYRDAFNQCELSDEKAWTNNDIYIDEEVIPKPDGSENIYEIIKVPMFNADGSRKGLVVLGRDITARKKAELERKDTIHELQFMNEIMAEANAVSNIDDLCKKITKKIHEANPKCFISLSMFEIEENKVYIKAVEAPQGLFKRITTMLGINPENTTISPDNMEDSGKYFKAGKLIEVEGGLFELMAGKVPLVICKNVERLFNRDKVYTIGISLDNKLVGGISIFKPKNTDLKYVSSIETIAKQIGVILRRKQVEEKLLYDAHILANVSDSIIATDLDRNITYWNNVAEKLYGWKQSEVLGKCIVNFIDVRVEGMQRDDFHANILREGFLRTEAVHIGRNGVPIIVDWSVTVIKNNQGEKIGTVSITRNITERKQQDQEKIKMATRLSLAVESGKIGIWELDLENDLLIWDDKMYELYGIEKTQFTDNFAAWQNALHPDKKEEYIQTSLKAINGEIPYDTEFRILRPDNTIRYIKANAEFMKDEYGNNIRMIGINYDITDHKNIEKELKEREERFYQLFDNINSGVAIYKPVDDGEDFEFVEINKAGEKLSNITIEKAKGKRITEIYPNVNEIGLLNAMQRVAATGKSEHLPLKMYKDNRITQWVENFVYRLPSGLIVAIYEDTSEKRRAEENERREKEVNQEFALLARKFMKHHSLDEISDIMLATALRLTSSEHGFVGYIEPETGYFNCASMSQDVMKACEVQKEGVIFKEFKGIWGWTLIHKKSMMTNNFTHDKRSIGLPDGHIPIKTFMASPALIGEQLIGQIAVSNKSENYTDLDLKNLERLADLYAIAVERIRNEQIIAIAKREAEDSNKLKKSLLLNMSHEVRTPINGIMGLTSVLIDLIEETEYVELLNKVQNSTKRLLATLSNVITYAQLTAKSHFHILEDIHINRVIENIYDEYKYLAINKKIKLLYETNSESIYVKANLESINQIFSNLIDNAIKFTNEGEIAISIHCDETSCTFKIKDSGIGITKKDQELIFDEFRQVSEGYNRAYEGTGLGLAIVKRNVELLRGTIELESSPNKGTTFIIKLPRSNVSLVNNEAADSGTHTNNAKITRKSKPKVLVVEDNQINIEVIKLQFLDVFNIHSAINGEEALVLLKKNDYDLILMDINLGYGMDGIEVAKTIREKNHSETPIIAVTGYVFEEDKQLILNNGFNGYISKPFTKNQLEEEIRKVIDI